MTSDNLLEGDDRETPFVRGVYVSICSKQLLGDVMNGRNERWTQIID